MQTSARSWQRSPEEGSAKGEAESPWAPGVVPQALKILTWSFRCFPSSVLMLTTAARDHRETKSEDQH